MGDAHGRCERPRLLPQPADESDHLDSAGRTTTSTGSFISITTEDAELPSELIATPAGDHTPVPFTMRAERTMSNGYIIWAEVATARKINGSVYSGDSGSYTA